MALLYLKPPYPPPTRPLIVQPISARSAPCNSLTGDRSPKWGGHTFRDTVLGGDGKDRLSAFQSLDVEDQWTPSRDLFSNDNPMVWAKIDDALPAPMEKYRRLNNEHTEFGKDPYSPLFLPNRRTYRGGHELWSTVASFTGVIAAYTMNRYTLQRHDLDLDQQMQSSYTGFNALIMHPSPEIFVAASIIHGVSTYAYYETRSKDRFRECFLAFGAAFGSAAVLLAGISTQALLSGFLPGILILSSILCTGVNILWTSCVRNRSSNKDQEWGGEAV